MCLSYIPRKEIALPNIWKLLFFLKKYAIVFIYLGLCWVFVAVRFSSCSEQRLRSGCGGFSCGRAWALGHGGVSGCSSQAPEHKFSSCETFLDQGSNPCLLPWQVDSSPLSHQGSPIKTLHYIYSCFLYWMHSLDLV